MLFKVASSALFCRGKPPTTLEQALARLGTRQVLSLARAVALSSQFPESGQSALRLFWQRSRAIATLAAIIANDRVSVCNVFPDQAYTAGIFLECGVPVLMQRFPDYCTHLLENGEFFPPRMSEEDQRFNVDHCSIGYLVARHWHLPDFVAQAVLHHYDLPSDEAGATRSLVAMLQLACYVYCVIHGVYDPNWPRNGATILAELGIHADDQEIYIEEIREQFFTDGH